MMGGDKLSHCWRAEDSLSLPNSSPSAGNSCAVTCGLTHDWAEHFNHSFVIRLVRLSQTLSLEQALVDTMQIPCHGWSDERIVLDVEQVIDDEPDGLIGGHPVLAIETLQVDGDRKAAQGPLAPQIDVGIEITYRQLA